MALIQPGFEGIQAPDCFGAGFSRAELKNFAACNGLAFFFENVTEIFRSKLSAFRQSPCGDLTHAHGTQATAGTHQRVEHVRCESCAAAARDAGD